MLIAKWRLILSYISILLYQLKKKITITYLQQTFIRTQFDSINWNQFYIKKSILEYIPIILERKLNNVIEFNNEKKKEKLTKFVKPHFIK